MKRSQYLNRAQEAFCSGRVDEYTYDAMLMNADIFCDDDDEDEDSTEMRVSINNGRTFCTIPEAIEGMAWNVLVMAMDDSTREKVADMGLSTHEEFLTEYLTQAPCDLIVG